MTPSDTMGMDAQQLQDLLYLAGLSARDLPSFLGLSKRQVRRYLNGTAPVPVTVARLLWLRAGFLGHLSGDWAGWRLVPRRGELVSPEGDVWTAAQLRGLHWHHEGLAAERAALRAEIRALRARLEALAPPPADRPALRVIEGGNRPKTALTVHQGEKGQKSARKPCPA